MRSRPEARSPDNGRGDKGAPNMVTVSNIEMELNLADNIYQKAQLMLIKYFLNLLFVNSSNSCNFGTCRPTLLNLQYGLT